MLRSTIEVIKEIFKNRYRLFRLAVYDLKIQASGTFLGSIWHFLNPALQILVYWLVFSVGLRVAQPTGDYPYIIWMIVGVIPWFFINEAMMNSMNSIFKYKDVLKRTAFPVSLMPIKTIITAFINHLFSMVIVMIIFFLYGGHIGIHFLSLFYYMVAALFFLSAYGIFSSSIATIVRDFEKLMFSIIRLLFYISPIVWSAKNTSSKLAFYLKFNPLTYLIDGYRDSILYNTPFYVHWKYGLYFWGVSICLFIFGCMLHKRFREQFMDIV